MCGECGGDALKLNGGFARKPLSRAKTILKVMQGRPRI